MIKVKVCGMSDPGNVKEVAEATPDFMGFIFYPGSPRYVGEDPADELFYNVTPGIKKIGVFLDEDYLKIMDLADRSGLDIIQLHGNESPSYCRKLKSAGHVIIKSFSIDKSFSFESLIDYIPGCDYFLFDTKTELHGGSGRKFNWEILEEYSVDKPFFLGGGISTNDVDEIKSFSNRGLFAVDINSCFETLPGIKDAGMVRTFINKLKNISHEL